MLKPGILSTRTGPGNHLAGVSLIELLVAMAISLVVSLAMITLMANTLGTGKQTIEMSRLTAELRTALQIMTRDVRRANYHGNYIACFANVNCRSDGSLEAGASSFIKAVTVGDSVGTDDCLFFWFDRDSDGNITTDATDYVGAFRRALVGGVGVIQMTLTTKTVANCTTGGNWFAISNPNIVDITDMTVSDALSFTDTVSSAGATQSVGKIGVSISGVLVKNNAVSKTVLDLVRIRNDIYAP